MLQVAQVAVEILDLPKAACTLKNPIGFQGCERFPAMKNPRQRHVHDPNKRVHMVGHHHPGEKTITLALEMKQCILDEFSNP